MSSRGNDELLWILGGAGVAGGLAYLLSSRVQGTIDEVVAPIIEKIRVGSGPFFDDFLRATATAGVPDSWADDSDLLTLVQHESNWDPSAMPPPTPKNPNPTAFGLFQFIKTTWDEYLTEVPWGTVDPYWQAVGGFRYIAARYGDPSRAWAFWQSTKKKNAALAPDGLQDVAQTWINKFWVGY